MWVSTAEGENSRSSEKYVKVLKETGSSAQPRTPMEMDAEPEKSLVRGGVNGLGPQSRFC